QCVMRKLIPGGKVFDREDVGGWANAVKEPAILGRLCPLDHHLSPFLHTTKIHRTDIVDGGANMYEKRRFEIAALWQNLWVKMAHSASRQASPLRVATGGDASWRLEARRRRSPACWRNAWPPPAATSGRMLAGLITL